MHWLPSVLSVGTSLTGLADVFFMEWGTATSYRRLSKIAIASATALDQLNTLYTCFGVSFPALKWVEGAVLLAGLAFVLAERKWEGAQSDQIPRALLNLLNATRLAGELPENILFGGHQVLKTLDPLWHTLIAFEIGSRLALIDKNRENRSLPRQS